MHVSAWSRSTRASKNGKSSDNWIFGLALNGRYHSPLKRAISVFPSVSQPSSNPRRVIIEDAREERQRVSHERARSVRNA